MKKLIFSAAIILLCTGFAAAQSNTSKSKKQPQKGIVKLHSTSDNTAKKDTAVVLQPVRIQIPSTPADTSTVPKVKKDDQ